MKRLRPAVPIIAAVVLLVAAATAWSLTTYRTTTTILAAQTTVPNGEEGETRVVPAVQGTVKSSHSACWKNRTVYGSYTNAETHAKANLQTMKSAANGSWKAPLIGVAPPTPEKPVVKVEVEVRIMAKSLGARAICGAKIEKKTIEFK
jgi:hypothetical protein